MKSDILKVIADNPALTEELKALFNRYFTLESLDTSGVPNAELGEIVRARVEGKKLIDEAFLEIRRYATPEARTPKVNGAR